MIHIAKLRISEKQNLGRNETELNFYFTKRPKGHIYQLAQKATKSLKAAGWAWLDSKPNVLEYIHSSSAFYRK